MAALDLLNSYLRQADAGNPDGTAPDLGTDASGSAPATGPAAFALQYGPAALRAGARLGVDPSVLLGQWGLETGWGKKIIPGTNNLGNIKDFSGGGVAAHDNQTGSDDRYRQFADTDDFADHYVDLVSRKYPGAINAGSDAARFAKGLQAGGYAQDPNYAAKVQASARTVAGLGGAPAPDSTGQADQQGAADPYAAILSAGLAAKPATAPDQQDGNFVRGVKTAFKQLPQLGYGLMAGAGATAENMVGEGGIATGIKNAGLQGYQAWGDQLQKDAKQSDSFTYAYDQASKGDLGSLADWLAYSIGYAGGQGIQMLATAGVGSIIGKAGLKVAAEKLASGLVTKEAARIAATKEGAALSADALTKVATSNVAAHLGQTAAVGAHALGMEGGEIYGDLVSDAAKNNQQLTGADLARAFGATLAAGSLEFVGDKLGLEVLLGKSPFFKPAEAMPGIKGRLARGALAAAAETPIEAGTEFGQTMLEEYGKGNDPFSAETMKQSIDAAAQGAVGGTTMGVAGGLAHGPKEHEQKPGFGTPPGQQQPPAAPGAPSAPPPLPADAGPLQRAAHAAAQAGAPAVAAPVDPAAAGAQAQQQDATPAPGAAAPVTAAPAQTPDDISGLPPQPPEVQGIPERLAEIDARLEELRQIGHGRPAQKITDADGKPVEIPATPPRYFTPAEQEEFRRLQTVRASLVEANRPATPAQSLGEIGAAPQPAAQPAPQASAQPPGTTLRDVLQPSNATVPQVEASDHGLSHLAAQARATARQEGLRQQSEHETVQARLAAAQAAESAARRQALLDQVLEANAEGSTASKLRAFSARLRADGYQNIAPSDDEISHAQRHTDMVTALNEPEYAAPNELVDAVPERAAPQAAQPKARKAPAPALPAELLPLAQQSKDATEFWKALNRAKVPTGQRAPLMEAFKAWHKNGRKAPTAPTTEDTHGRDAAAAGGRDDGLAGAEAAAQERAGEPRADEVDQAPGQHGTGVPAGPAAGVGPGVSVANEAAHGQPALNATASPLVSVRDLRGVTHYVREHELQNPNRTLLRRHHKNGTPIYGEGKTSLHRGNIDTDGSAAKETWKDVPYFTAANDRPFATSAAAVAAVKRYGQDPAEFEFQQVNGGYVAVRKALLETEGQSTQPPETPEAAGHPPVDPAVADLAGHKLDREWTAFAPDSGTLGIPRADMPQVKAEHRGALTQFLKARGIGHEQEQDVLPSTLKPTQREFSNDKVEQAKEHQGGDRAILVSSDGHILDGHHQWLANLEDDKPIRVIRFDAPIRELIKEAHEFPSAEVADGAKVQAEPAPAHLSIGKTPNSTEPVTVRDGVVHIGDYPAQDFDSGENVTVPQGAGPQQIKDALAKAGAIGRGNKIFGMPKDGATTEASTPAAPQEAAAPVAHNGTPEAAGETMHHAQPDVLNNVGKPFTMKFGAEKALKDQGLSATHEVVKTPDGYVGRVKQAAEQQEPAHEAEPEPAAPQPAPAEQVPAPDPAVDPLDAELQDALGHLGDVLGDVFGAKLNMTGKQHGAGDLLPALSKVIELLVRKGFRSFSAAVGASAKAMRTNPAVAEHLDKVSARQWKAAYNAVAEFHEGTDSEEAVAAMPAEQVLQMVVPAQPPAVAHEPVVHNGTRIYPVKFRVQGEEARDRWAVESPENKAKREAGQRHGMGDTVHDTLDQAKQAADRERADVAARAEYASQQQENAVAEEARKEANRGKTLVQRKIDSTLDKPTRLPPQAGLGIGTRREAMAKAVEQGRAIVEKMVEDNAARKNDQETVDAASRRGYMLSHSNPNIPAVKAAIEASTRLKANRYLKPEYRVHADSKADSPFYTISKTEHDYAKGLMTAAQEKAAAAPASPVMHEGSPEYAALEQRAQANDAKVDALSDDQVRAMYAAMNLAGATQSVDKLRDTIKAEHPDDVEAGLAAIAPAEASPAQHTEAGQAEPGPTLDALIQQREAEIQAITAAHAEKIKALGRRKGELQRGTERGKIAKMSAIDDEGADLDRQHTADVRAVLNRYQDRIEQHPETLAKKARYKAENEAAKQKAQEVAPAAPVAQHIENGQAEPATAPVIAASIQKSANNTVMNNEQARADLLKHIDEAIATASAAEDARDIEYTEAQKAWSAAKAATPVDEAAKAAALARMQAARPTAGKTMFDVHGDGKFTVINDVEHLQRFRDQVKKTEGFKGTTSKKPFNIPFRLGGSPETTMHHMLEDGEMVGAHALAKEIGKPFRFTVNGKDKNGVPNLFVDARDVTGMPHGVTGYVGRMYGTKGAPWLFIESHSGLSIGTASTSADAAVRSAREKLNTASKDVIANGIQKMAATTTDQAALEAQWLEHAEKSDQAFRDKLDADERQAANARQARAAEEAAAAEKKAAKERAEAEKLAKSNGPADYIRNFAGASVANMTQGNVTTVLHKEGADVPALAEFIIAKRPGLERAVNSSLQALGYVRQWDGKVVKRAEEPAAPARAKIGDALRIGGVDGILAHTSTMDGVRYELYNANKISDQRGVVRAVDADTNSTVTVKVYPTYDQAQREYDEALLKHAPEEAPAPDVPAGFKPLREKYYHDFGRGKVLTQGYAPHDLGDRVKNTNTGHTGVIEGFIGSGPLIHVAMVKYDNGTTQSAPMASLEAEVKDAAPAEPAPQGRIVHPDSLNPLVNPVAHGDVVQLADGSKWEARQGYTGMGWSLVKDKQTHPLVTNANGQQDFIARIIQANQQAKAAPQSGDDNPDLHGYAYAIVKDGQILTSGSLPAPQYGTPSERTKLNHFKAMADQMGGDLYLGSYPDTATDARPMGHLIMGMTWQQIQDKQQGKRVEPDQIKGKMPKDAALVYSPAAKGDDADALDRLDQLTRLGNEAAQRKNEPAPAAPEPARDLTARPTLPPDESGYEALRARQLAYTEPFLRWLATLPDSTINSQSALATKIGKTPMHDWVRIDNGDKHRGKSIDFLQPDGKVDVREFPGGMSSPNSGYTVQGAHRDLAAILHNMVAQVEGARKGDVNHYAADRVAAERYKAGEPVGEAIRRLFAEGETAERAPTLDEVKADILSLANDLGSNVSDTRKAASNKIIALSQLMSNAEMKEFINELYGLSESKDLQAGVTANFLELRGKPSKATTHALKAVAPRTAEQTAEDSAIIKRYAITAGSEIGNMTVEAGLPYKMRDASVLHVYPDGRIVVAGMATDLIAPNGETHRIAILTPRDLLEAAKYGGSKFASRDSINARKDDVDTPIAPPTDDTLTPDQAKQQMTWRDLGQRDGVITHRLMFNEDGPGDGSGSITIANVQKIGNSGKWQIDDAVDRYDTLREAKKAATEAGLAYLRREGYVAKEDAPAATKSPLDVHGPINVAEHQRTMEALYDGELPLAALKANFQRMAASEQDVKAELNAKKKDDLLEMGGAYFEQRHKGDTKGEIVNALYDQMLMQYAIGTDGAISYTLGGGMNTYAEAKRASITKAVDALTQEDMQAFQEKVRQQRADARARMDQHRAALTDPKTLDDYSTLLRSRMAENSWTFKQARMSLTPNQRGIYDDLAADSSRAERAQAKVEKQEQTLRVPGEPLRATEIIKTRHTKHGHDLWQFQLEQRVPDAEYEDLKAKARALGGNYSWYNRDGAIPGWQFKSQEAAEAFRKLIAGDDTAAKDVMQARRDAFADDKSQSTVERLTEMADRLEQWASDSQSAERKTNTARRARFAASADAVARGQRAMAETMRNLAAAIQDGKARFLDKLRQKTQIALLDTLARNARDAAADAEFPVEPIQKSTYNSWTRPAGYDKRIQAVPTVADIDHTEWPSYTAFRSDLARLGRQLLEIDGTKLLGQKLMKVADDVTKAYLDFAKANLNQVAHFSNGKGERASFANKETAEEAIRRSGYRGKAIVLQVKRGENLIILSPSEAMERGIWKGDGDKKITLHPEIGAELVEKLGRINRRTTRVDVPWQFETAHDRLKALARMNIQTPAELRAALREYMNLKVAPQEADKVKELERSMVGRAKDGLDFFPTPADQADEMIETAGLQAGMRVLEPSAGMGHIADRIREAGVEPDVVEMSGDRRELLEAKGYNLVGHDFMDLKETPRGYTFGDLMEAPDGTRGILRGLGGLGSDRVRLVDPDDPKRVLGYYNFSELEGVELRGYGSGYDRIIMNPPFSDRRDAEHVQHAYDLLKPGGRLVAIMGEGVFFGQDKRAQNFRDWLDAHGGTSEKLAEGTFMDPSLPVNTGVNARMVVIDKPGSSAEAGEPLMGNLRAVPGFYSELQRQVAAVPDKQAVRPADQWASWLQANAGKLGVKKDEIEWSGITDYLHARGKDKVSRDELVAFLGQNGVQVQEVEKGQHLDAPAPTVEQLAQRYPADVAMVRAAGFEPRDMDGELAFWQKEDDHYAEARHLRIDYGVDHATAAAALRLVDAFQSMNPVDNTKYGQYTLPGGENYRELLLTLPRQPFDREAFKQAVAEGRTEDAERMREAQGAGTYKSNHWSEPNILAHVRFDDRTDADGKRVLFIEELQSDWGQDGLKKGFKEGAPYSQEQMAEAGAAAREALVANDFLGFDNAVQAMNAIREHADWRDRWDLDTPEQYAAVERFRDMAEANKGKHAGVPTAPFVTDTKSWLSLGIKRMIRYAAENGYDRIAFVNGQQSADRYNLSQQVDKIDYYTRSGQTMVAIYPKGHAPVNLVVRDGVVGNAVKTPQEYVGKRFDDIVGKEIADRILNDKNDGTLEGDGLNLGGEGMKTFYDRIVPQTVNDVLKKLGGGKVGSTALVTDSRLTRGFEYHGPVMTEAQLDDFIRTNKLSAAIEAQLKEVRFDVMEGKSFKNAMEDQASPAAAEAIGGTLTERDPEAREQMSFDITPALRDKAMAGMPLFARAEEGQTASPFDQRLHDAADSGASAADLLHMIATESENPDNRALAEQMLANGVNPTIGTGSSQGQAFTTGRAAEDYAASYSPSAHHVSLYEAQDAERNLLHELTHAATAQALRAGGRAAMQIKALYADAKRSGQLAGMYGMANVDEFVAEAHSNPQFQQALAAIQSGPRSLWDRFVDIVRSVLGLAPAQRDMLSAVLRAGRDLMQENAGQANGATMANSRTGAIASRIGLPFKESTRRTPELTEGANRLMKGEIGRDEYNRLVDVYKPVEPYQSVPEPATDDQMRAALTKDKVPKLNAGEIAPGTPVGIRLDIPAYKDHGVWVVSVHEGKRGGKGGPAGKPISYQSTAHVMHPNLAMAESGALKIAAGAAKNTLATIGGEWVGSTPEQAVAQARHALNDPAWVQVGIDPERHSYFYDRATMEPVVSGSEAIQVGGLVLVKDPVYGKKDDFLFNRRDGNAQAAGSETEPLMGNLRDTPSLPDALANAATNPRDINLWGGYKVGDFLNKTGKVGWWFKTIGTPKALAEHYPAFRPVYEAVQRFLADVSRFATAAGDLAPRLMPQLETLADINPFGKNRKKAVSAEDTRAIATPIFDGTKEWARDAHGKPVLVDDLRKQAENLTPDQKAQILLQKGEIDDQQLKAWRALPPDTHDAAVENRFEATQLQPGVVWTDAELRSMFNLNDGQIGLYHEFRAAVDKSLTNLTISEMTRIAGHPDPALVAQAVAMPDLQSAAALLRDHYVTLARMHPDMADMHLATATQIMNKADHGQNLIDRGYAPLQRFGRYTVYMTEEGEPPYFGMYETAADAAQAARTLKEKFPAAFIRQGTMSQEEYKLFANVSPESMELFGSMLGLGGDANAADKAYQKYIQLTKSNHSALKRMLHRKGTDGYSEDVGRVLASFLYSNARLTSSNFHTGEIDEGVNEIPKEQGELKDEAIALRQHVRDPQSGGTFLSGLMFAQDLGGSVASAAVNFTQPVMTTLPYLSQWGGIGKAGSRLLAAVRDARKESTGDAALDAALEQYKDVVSPQEVHSMQAQAAGKATLRAGDGTRAGDLRAKANNTMAAVRVAWGKLFAMAEQSNRRITFIAAYRTAMEQGNLGDAGKFAAQLVHDTQFVANAGNKMPWGRNQVGGLLMTFKGFSIQYLEMLGKMAFAGAPGSPERAAGRRAVLYAMAVMLMMAGSRGIPFEQDLEAVIDGILQRMGYNFSSKRAMHAFLANKLGDGFADFAASGASGLPGAPFDMAGRLGAGHLIPGIGALRKKESYTSDVAEIAGPAADLVKRGFTAAGKAVGGDIAGAALDLSPQAVRNAAQGVDMWRTGTYRDARGYIVNHTTPLEAGMKALGFQPNSTADIQDAKRTALDMISQARMRSNEIAERWAQGRANNDEAMVNEARAMRDDWNAKNPDTPVRVSMPGVMHRARAMREDALQRTQQTAGKALKAAVSRELATGRE